MPDASSVEGAIDADARAERVEQEDVGAGDPRMQDIAADRHDQPGNASFMAADGERVEQGLGRVLMAAVAGIDHRAVDLLGEELDGARSMVAHDENVGAHGVQRHRRVDQGLALRHGRGLRRHVHHVGAQPLARKLEGALGPGRGFEEEIDQGAAAEIVALLGDLAADGRRLLPQDRAGPRSRRAKGLRSQADGDEGRRIRSLRPQCSLKWTL